MFNHDWLLRYPHSGWNAQWYISLHINLVTNHSYCILDCLAICVTRRSDKIVRNKQKQTWYCPYSLSSYALRIFYSNTLSYKDFINDRVWVHQLVLSCYPVQFLRQDYRIWHCSCITTMRFCCVILYQIQFKFNSYSSVCLLGAVGSAIATPTDLVKVRQQACRRVAGQEKRYEGTFRAFATIWQTEGLRGLYVGMGPTVKRAAILTATQVSFVKCYSSGRKTHLSPSVI